MSKLSDTQRVILSRAAQHDALLAEPPARLPAAARQSVLRSLMTKGLLEEVSAPREAIALGWRQDEDGVWIALRITAAGLASIGVEADSETGATTDGEQEDQRPRDERHGVDPGLVIGDLVEDVALQAGSTAQETGILPAAAQGESLAVFSAAPPSNQRRGARGASAPACESARRRWRRGGPAHCRDRAAGLLGCTGPRRGRCRRHRLARGAFAHRTPPATSCRDPASAAHWHKAGGGPHSASPRRGHHHRRDHRRQRLAAA
jgi:hypothetical protein